MNKNTLKWIFDLLIIFSPFLLLLGGTNKFLVIFYLIYLPSLILSVIEFNNKKKEKNLLVEKNTTQIKKLKKQKNKNLVIS
jgi:hypothetical protein